MSSVDNIVYSVSKLLEKIILKKPKYKKDIMLIYSYALFEDYDTAFDYLINFLIQCSHDPDLQEFRTEVLQTIIYLAMEGDECPICI